VGHDDKTEKATPQRRRKARQEGQIPRSAEIGVAATLGAGAVALRTLTPPGFERLREDTARLLSSSPVDTVALADLGGITLGLVVALAGPLMAVGVVTAVVAGVAQTGGSMATKLAAPKLSNLSPKRGLSRLKPGTAGWELVRTAVKLGLLVAAVYEPLRSFTDVPPTARSLDDGITVTLNQAWILLQRTLLVAGLVAAADYVWNLRKVGKQTRMSKDEVKQEYKQQEGDPLIKSQRKRRAAELSRGRMVLDTALADVVVTNPTHLAVALRFEPGEAAPRVVAKGADHLAKRIREEAHRNGVPVREDVPLARALHRSCKVGAYVPGGLYEAVAVVLAQAYRLRGRVAA